MTINQARATLCIWSHNKMIIAVLKRYLVELRRFEESMCYSPTTSMREGGHTQHYGDSLAYAVSLSDEFAKRGNAIKRLMEYVEGISREVEAESPRDPLMRRMIRAKEKHQASWEGAGSLCGMDPKPAIGMRRAMLRRLCDRPWTDRERVVVRFAFRHIKRDTLKRALYELNVVE